MRSLKQTGNELEMTYWNVVIWTCLENSIFFNDRKGFGVFKSDWSRFDKGNLIKLWYFQGSVLKITARSCKGNTENFGMVQLILTFWNRTKFSQFQRLDFGMLSLRCLGEFLISFIIYQLLTREDWKLVIFW